MMFFSVSNHNDMITRHRSVWLDGPSSVLLHAPEEATFKRPGHGHSDKQLIGYACVFAN
jgi:hypothetical protein